MGRPRAIVLNNVGGGFDILVRRLPHANETVMMRGMVLSEDLAKGGNVAVALARLGVSCAIVGKVGVDEAGDRDAAWMAEAGVDLSELIRDPDAMTGQGIGLIADDDITGFCIKEVLENSTLVSTIVVKGVALFFPNGNI